MLQEDHVFSFILGIDINRGDKIIYFGQDKKKRRKIDQQRCWSGYKNENATEGEG